jgi:hypothetical protein
VWSADSGVGGRRGLERAHGRAALAVDAEIDDDAIEPGGEAGGAELTLGGAPVRRLRPDAQEGLLGDLLGVAARAGDALCHRHRLAQMAAHQFAEGDAVAIADTHHQVLVGRVGHRLACQRSAVPAAADRDAPA